MSSPKVSNCCGAVAQHDMQEEACLCSACGEYCEYVEEEEFLDDESIN